MLFAHYLLFQMPIHLTHSGVDLQVFLDFVGVFGWLFLDNLCSHIFYKEIGVKGNFYCENKTPFPFLALDT